MNFYLDQFIIYLKKNYLSLIIIILNIVSIILLSYFIFIKYSDSCLNSNNVSSEIAVVNEDLSNVDELDDEETLYLVDIKGAVKNPGVYEVDSKLHVNDVIKLAGGTLKSADTTNINLSKSLKDEMVIYIPKKSSDTSSNVVSTSSSNVVNDANVDTSNSVGYEDTTNSSSSETTSDKVNINTADVSLLMTLSGVGEAKANAIIEYRNTNGLFKSIEDIMNVSGIGNSAFEKIKDYITV